MTKESTEKLPKTVKTWISIQVVLTLAVLTLWAFTGLALVAVGLWAGVVWVWIGIFALRSLLNGLVRIVVAVLSKAPPKSGKFSDQVQTLGDLLKEQNLI